MTAASSMKCISGHTETNSACNVHLLSVVDQDSGDCNAHALSVVTQDKDLESASIIA